MLTDSQIKARVNGYNAAALSADYWHAAYAIELDRVGRRHGHIFYPKYNCLCQSAELAMKAFLYLNEIPPKKVRKFGHCLPDLYNACDAVMPLLEFRDIQAIMLMHSTYSKHIWRYGQADEGEISFAREPLLMNAVAKLVDLSTGDPGVLRNARGRGPTLYFVWPADVQHPRIAPFADQHLLKDRAARASTSLAEKSNGASR